MAGKPEIWDQMALHGASFNVLDLKLEISAKLLISNELLYFCAHEPSNEPSTKRALGWVSMRHVHDIDPG